MRVEELNSVRLYAPQNVKGAGRCGVHGCTEIVSMKTPLARARHVARGLIARDEGVGCPQGDSNARTRLRRPVLYPLSYGG